MHFLSLRLAACARSVSVSANFPPPLLDPYPLTAGIRYPAELGNFVHVEDPALEPEWTIRLGEANLLMFRSIFGGMFARVVELEPDAGTAADPDIDFIIEPKLEELEFSVPHQSGTDQYVVWLRYTLHMTKPDGELIGDWRLTAYGQEDQGNMGLGATQAMREAAITALRDAAANIAIGFPTAPGVSEHILVSDEPDAPAEETI